MNVREIKDGMIVANTILTHDKKVLLYKGMILNAELITRLMAEGISEIDIFDKDVPETFSNELKFKSLFKQYGVNNLKDLKQCIINEIEEKFKLSSHDPIINEIKTIIIENRFASLGLKEEFSYYDK